MSCQGWYVQNIQKQPFSVRIAHFSGENLLALSRALVVVSSMTILKNIIRYVVASCLLSFLTMYSTALAVNYATGARVASGYQLNLYPFYYSADIRTDGDGSQSIKDLGLKRYGTFIGNNYYSGDLFLGVNIPVGTIDVGKLNAADSGIGDIQARIGWFLPVDIVTLLPVIMVKIPSGSYDVNRPVNFGDGQADIVSELYFFKLLQTLSLDTVLKYAVRFRNSASDITPGNEFTIESLLTGRVADNVRMGPAVNFITSDDSRKGGTALANSGITRLSLGGEIFYGGFKNVKISLAAYEDIRSHNSSEGLLTMGRFTFRF